MLRRATAILVVVQFVAELHVLPSAIVAAMVTVLRPKHAAVAVHLMSAVVPPRRAKTTGGCVGVPTMDVAVH